MATNNPKVGHNFTPEYQISAVPYCVTTGDTNLERIVVRKADGLVVGTTVHGNEGQTVTTNGLVADNLIFTDVGSKVDNGLTNDFVIIKRLVIPYITQWIQIIPGSTAAFIYFGRTHAANGNTTRGIKTLTNTENNTLELSHPLSIRCTNLYFPDTVNENVRIYMGLTSIDRSEFTEVVERFLGDTA